MLQNVLRAAGEISQDLIHVGTLVGHPRIAVPTAIYLLALSRFSTDAQIAFLIPAAFIPTMYGIFTCHPRHRLIGLGIGLSCMSQFAYLTITEVTRMIQEGCNPPSHLPYLEQYLVCKYGQ